MTIENAITKLHLALSKAVSKNVGYDICSQVSANVFRPAQVAVRSQVHWPIWEELNEQL